LDQNGFDLAYDVIFDGGTLTTSSKTRDQQIDGGLDVKSQGTLLGQTSGMNVYGAISGSGKLNISGKQGVSFFGDTSAFTGDLVMKAKGLLYLTPLNDTVLAANITQDGNGKVY
ncbi:hypothetical protein, partial [Hafnia alvei]